MKFLNLRRIRYLPNVLFAISFLATLIFVLSALYAGSRESGREADRSAKTVEPCGTWIALTHIPKDKIPGESLARPPYGPIISDSDHFRVHYSDNQLDGYAQDILSAAEKAYRVLIDTLGYFSPPPDTGGGDSRTDIYVRSSAVFPYLGETQPESWIAAPFPNSYTSYIQLTDTMGTDLLLTTTVHEFFHVIQIGYDALENVSFLEMISVWSEDRVYDDINAYLRHLPKFFSSPEKALFGHTYSNVVWAIYLAENFGSDVIRDILETCGSTAGNNIRPATESVLAGLGTDLASEISTFTLWNFFTGARDNGQCYEEGASYPLVSIERTVECLPLFDYTTLHKPGTLGCNYFEIYGDHYTDSLALEVIPEWWAASVVTLTRFTDGGVATEDFLYPQFTLDPPPIVEPAWDEIDSLLLIYSIDMSGTPSNNFGLSAYHTGIESPVQPFVLVLDRDGCRRPFDGFNDDFSERDGEDYPFADAFAERSVNFFLSDSIPKDLSPCDAIFVIGGYDAAGVDLEPAELETLMAFMDRGGDIYLESNCIGQWLDPLVGSPSPTEEAFWNYFGCGFLPGDTMTIGNVSTWRTLDSTPVGAYLFAYDAGGPPDDFVGELVPSTAETLVVDQGNHVRSTIINGPNESYRIHSTILLGASTGIGSTRGDYMYRILEVFDSTVPSLAVGFINLAKVVGGVDFEGKIEGYSGEELLLVRIEEGGQSHAVKVPLVIRGEGGEIWITATDSPPAGRYHYRLLARVEGGILTLWEGHVTVEAPPLSVSAVFPNPSRGGFTLLVESPNTEAALMHVYDAAGRLVYQNHRILHSGTNALAFDGRDGLGRALPSGVYFIRLDTSNNSSHRKVVIVR
ncbi:MAG: T9SS type A sorting domain-containing protein [Candidatus Latescibacteria bacterium]|nr:T9SS type A sorting domain-containing protein [Candidatus Latescibacterota bacterium]NIM21014.1 T9SS type A sorting domain-containing protein [Candidatus Latescibacterota bacterium]NIM65149.1 T9SS type A sorting domain-containing protein [Candidatus Latescibacterota bacterium]NIO01664.1 T9SS type A sorting domain-containing protein [Candidatus Latescibacterota bacterium]NIO28181.1 T9SS type A sorting domain-containing protein [Candidatus Latescibacterota bacterium]